MGLFNRKNTEKEIKVSSEKKGLNLNKVNKDDLMNIAGGLTTPLDKSTDKNLNLDSNNN